MALLDAAQELGAELGDLAPLVLASEQQRPAPTTAEGPDGLPKPSLYLVGDDPVTKLKPLSREPSGGTDSWVLRDPQRLGARAGPPVAAWSEPDPELTIRELAIITFVTRGLSNQQIAEASFLSINSVKTYVRSAYRKMGVETRAQALLWGVDHGLRRPGAGRTWEPVVPTETCPPDAPTAEP